MNKNKRIFAKRTCSLILAVMMFVTSLSTVIFANDADQVLLEEAEPARDAYGANGMVSAADPVAAQIGVDILKAGGNAADAAVATAFALGLVEPAASGIGGSGFMIYYDAKADKTTTVNYYFECPRGMTLDTFKDVATDKAAGLGGKRAVVPGMVAGMLKVNELFGTMSMAELVAPTVKMAEEGAPVSSFITAWNTA